VRRKAPQHHKIGVKSDPLDAPDAEERKAVIVLQTAKHALWIIGIAWSWRVGAGNAADDESSPAARNAMPVGRTNTTPLQIGRFARRTLCAETLRGEAARGRLSGK
jgi:hypothetical protein